MAIVALGLHIPGGNKPDEGAIWFQLMTIHGLGRFACDPLFSPPKWQASSPAGPQPKFHAAGRRKMGKRRHESESWRTRTQRARAFRESVHPLRRPAPRPMARITLAVYLGHGAGPAPLPHEPAHRRRHGPATSQRAPGPGTPLRAPACRRRCRATRLGRPADAFQNCRWRDGFAQAPGAQRKKPRARGPWGLGRAGFRRQPRVASVPFAGAAVQGSNYKA
jgi:hypothetical protein